MIRGGIVLVADDDLAIVQFIAEALADEGYFARLATDPTAAITMLVDEPADLALIDLRFGPMNGLDLVRAVRGRGVTTPIVIMTADSTEAGAIEAQGAFPCLRKPFDLGDLFACVAQHITRGGCGDHAMS